MENLPNGINWQPPQFPLEIWEHIIEKLPTSENIVTLLHTFPQLKGLSGKKQFHWLISEVLWLIIPNYLHNADILNCRRVCKVWKRNIDRLLEAHPRRLPYNSPRLTEMNDRHYMCIKFPEIRTHFWKMFHSVMEVGVIADSKGVNPFLGKYLEILSTRGPGMLRESLNFLKLLGYHLHHVSFFFFQVKAENTEETINLLFQCLSYLPNLRSLRIKASFLCDKQKSREIFGQIWKTVKFQLPANLEVLDLIDVSFNDFDDLHFYTGLLSAINLTQIKKLGVNFGYLNKQVLRKFPNLTEIVISQLHRFKRWNSMPRLRRILRAFKNTHGNLKKISFTMSCVDIYKLLRVLKPYNIEMLDAGLVSTRQKTKRVPTVVQTIKHLKLKGDGGTDLKLLKCFSNLEYLHLRMRGDDEDFEDYDYINEGFSYSVLSYIYLNRIHPEGFNIWEELSSLKMITATPTHETEEEGTCRRFVRELGPQVLIPKEFQSNYEMETVFD